MNSAHAPLAELLATLRSMEQTIAARWEQSVRQHIAYLGPEATLRLLHGEALDLRQDMLARYGFDLAGEGGATPRPPDTWEGVVQFASDLFLGLLAVYALQDGYRAYEDARQRGEDPAAAVSKAMGKARDRLAEERAPWIHRVTEPLLRATLTVETAGWASTRMNRGRNRRVAEALTVEGVPADAALLERLPSATFLAADGLSPKDSLLARIEAELTGQDSSERTHAQRERERVQDAVRHERLSPKEAERLLALPYYDSAPTAAAQPDPLAAFIEREELSRLVQAAGLTPAEAETVALWLEGVDGPERAQRMGIKPATARVHLRNAMQKLKKAAGAA